MASVSLVQTRLVEPEWVSRVPAPAHDSLSPAQRRRLIEENPRSYLAVTRSPDDHPEGGRWDSKEALALSKQSLDAILKAGAFGPVRAPSLYLYRLSADGHSQVGIVGTVATSDYDTGVVRVHESIQTVRSQDLALHLDGLRVQSSPIALAHRPDSTISTIVAQTISTKPVIVDFAQDDGLRQEVWAVEEEASRRLIDALADEPLYLIDGHHRAAAASLFHRSQPSDASAQILCAIFNTDEVRSDAFHRGLRNIDLALLLTRIRAAFPSRETDDLGEVEARHPREIAIATAEGWHLVTLPPSPDSEGSLLANLDSERFRHHVLLSMLDIDPTVANDQLSFLHGSGDEEDLHRVAEVVRADYQAIAVIRPIPMETLIAISDEGHVMPPKSTYFRPKVRSGVFLRPLP